MERFCAGVARASGITKKFPDPTLKGCTFKTPSYSNFPLHDLKGRPERSR